MAPSLTCNGLPWRAVGALAIGGSVIFGSLIVGSFPALAQIRPDASLGRERSRVTPNAQIRGALGDRIDGGAIRGVNLFHSFTDFNVRDLQRVYFNNPSGIENILTRVTGNTRSNILGTLGVDGNANLFLINPNGILFGPNAHLDIRGAFLASTADRFTFADGNEFRASDTNAPPPVTVNIPIGVQFGSNPPAGLINEATLHAGGSITLAAGTVTNLGQVSSEQGSVTMQEAVSTLPTQPGIAVAAIQPDTTLGSEQSHVTPQVAIQGQAGDRIDGGAIRGANLFHSFTAFNVLDAQRVYFADPTGVENILARITGPTSSNISGTLGVDGSANLFLLNPNGIIFGPNARLDIRGSLLASTGDRFTFPDGNEFNATNPNSAPSVAVNIPMGVQFGSPQADLTNQANLAVDTGRSLTLHGNTTRQEGSLAAPGGMVEVLGDRVALLDNSRIDVSSETGGGTVHIGGDYQGQGAIPNAQRTYVAPTATINADAITSGDGGRVIVWADGATSFYGNISARGGRFSGSGGFVEVSGLQSLLFQGLADTTAPFGSVGTVLLDPTNITIVAGATPNPANAADGVWGFGEDVGDQTIGAGAIVSLLNGADLILQATDSITINTNAPINYTGATPRTLTFQANNNIILNSNSNISINQGSITFTANEINLNSNVSGEGILTLQPSNAGQNIALGEGDNTNPSNALDLTRAELNRLQNGFSSIIIGRADSSGAISLQGNLQNNDSIEDPLTLRSPDGSVSTAGQSLTAPQLTINSGGPVQLGTTQIGTPQNLGNLNITAGGAITDNGNLTITGTTTLNSGSNDITLNNNNNFNTVEISNARNVILNDTDAIVLGASNVTGDLSVTANGNITDSGNLIVPGTTTLETADNRDITLDQTGNDFNTMVISAADDVTLRDQNNITLGNIDIDGILTVTATNNIQATNSNLTAETTNLTATNGDIAINGGQLITNGDRNDGPTSGFLTLTARNRVNLQDSAGTFTTNTTDAIGNLSITGNQGITIALTNPASVLRSGNNLTLTSGGLDASGNLLPGQIDATGTLAATDQITLQASGNNNSLNLTNSNLQLNAPTATVTAANLNISNSQLRASDNLTLLATSGAVIAGVNTLNPLPWVQAGNDLTIEGQGISIFPFNPSFPFLTPISFQSGNDLTLTSPNISIFPSPNFIADADRDRNGDLIINGALDSLAAIISAGGDVTFGSYTGTALKIEAGGSITATGNITITRAGSAFSSLTGSITPIGNVPEFPTSGPLQTALIDNSSGSVLLSSLAGSLDLIETDFNALSASPLASPLTEGSAIKFTLQVGANVALPIGFDWNFLTSEFGEPYNDLAFVSVSGPNVSRVVRLADAVSAQPTFTSTGSFSGATAAITNPNATPSVFTVGIGVLDALDTITDSSLRINNFAASDISVFNDPDIPMLSNSSALILRAGVPREQIGDTPFDRVLSPSSPTGLTSTLSGTPFSATPDPSLPGNITINGNINTQGNNASGGAGGPVTLSASGNIDIGNTAVRTTMNTSAATNTNGTGGAVEITAGGRVSITNHTITTSGEGTGDGGAIAIRAGSTSILPDQAAIALTDVRTDSAARGASGRTGDVSLLAANGGLIQLQGTATISTPSADSNARIFTDTSANSDRVAGQTTGGTLRIISGNLNSDNTLTDGGPININRYILDASVNGSSVGNGGDILIHGASVGIDNNSLIETTVEDASGDSNQQGNSGGIFIQGDNAVSVASGSIVRSTVDEGGEGRGGTITINSARGVTIAGAGTTVNADTNTDATTGTGGDIAITANTIHVNDQATLSASTSGAANGGNITLQHIGDPATGIISLTSGTIQTTTSGMTQATGNANDSGRGGRITINSGTRNITLGTANANSGFTINASTSGTGRAGTVALQGADITLSNSDIFSESLSDNSDAGNVSIVANSLTVQEQSQVSVQATQAGNAGNLSVDARQVTVQGGGEISASNVSSSQEGNITFRNLDRLQLTNGEISASTSTGVAGNINTNANEPAANSIDLRNSRIEARVTGDNSASRAGNVVLNAQNVSLAGNSAIATSNVSSAIPAAERRNFGNIQLNNVNQLTVANSEISASTESGVAGSVQVNATTESADVITLQQGTIQATATAAGGDAGSVTLNTQTLNAQNQSEISASTETGVAGSVSINVNRAAANVVNLQGSRIAAEATEDSSTSRAGNVTINAQDVTLTEGGAIATSNVSSAIPAAERRNFGNIQLNNVNQLTVANSEISASTESGVAGSVQVNATTESADVITLQQGTIQATATAAGGDAGSVTLNTQTLNAQNQSEISASTETGVAGSVSINVNRAAANVVNLQGSRIAAEATGNSPTSRAGNVTINAQDVTLTQGGTIATRNISSAVPTAERGNFGNIQLNNVNQLSVSGARSEISASTQTGVAGSVRINTNENEAANTVTIQGGRIAAEATAAGNNPDSRAGNVTINAQEVTLTQGGAIATSNVSSSVPAAERAKFGNIQLDNVNQLSVSGVRSGISASTETGVAGSVSINANGAAADSITLQGGRIAAEATGNSATSRAGNVTINARNVELTRGGAIATQNRNSDVLSEEQSNFGNIQLNNVDRLSMVDSSISASTRTGVAGNININTNQAPANLIDLQRSQIIARSTGENVNSRAGDVRLNARTVDIHEQSTIAASTRTGQAGSVSINALDTLTVRGNSQIAVTATGERGRAGNLNIRTGDLFVREGSSLTVSSEQGFAGNLTIYANYMNLNRGSVTALTGQGNGGANINIDIVGDRDFSGFLWLENESSISASALERATGGTVSINADFIFAFFPTGSNGSDITANAIAGDGGTVRVNALGLFGIQFRPLRTPLNDITASSQGGDSGVVQLTTPGIDPSRGFAVVPLSFLDLTNLVGQSCSVNILNRDSTFTVAGRGGVPLSPIDPLGADLDLTDWVMVPSDVAVPEPVSSSTSPTSLSRPIPRSLFCYSTAYSSSIDHTQTRNTQGE